MTKSNFILFLLFITLGGCVTSSSQRPSPNQNNTMAEKTFTYLALGDSYTIGEGVPVKGRFPEQLVAMLAEQGVDMEAPLIIAQTGWTTDELQAGVKNAAIGNKTYDWVTLLIGVNNQYRGRDVDNYKEEFTALLEQAIAFANGQQQRVAVISIPDWGVTEFASSRGVDQEKIAREIDTYNAVNLQVAEEMEVHYLDITSDYRQIGHLPEMTADDQLHPSAEVYRSWAEKLVPLVLENRETSTQP